MQALLISTPLSFFLLLSIAARAQFLQVDDAVTGPYTAQNLISKVFLGEGVQVTNIQFNGDPRAVGYFSGGTQSIGIERGIVMTSGYADRVIQNGSAFASEGNFGGSVEPSLLSLLPPPAPGQTQQLNNVAVYTITFIPNADTLRFRYCFGSEEYPEYACSPYNDVFGFFIQGPGYPTFTNIAKVPGTNLAVSINNIHPLNSNPNYQPCPPFNVQYYRDNNNSSQQPVYDGYTTVLTAQAVVTPCQPYTIKLAIADVGDTAYDSGVFLEAKSFGTGALRVAATTNSPDGVMAEGCAQGTVTFTLPELRAQNFPIVYNVLGTATQGVDYPNLPTNLVIPAGQTTVSFNVDPFEDGLNEPLETIAIAVKVDPCNWDTVYLFIRDKILLPPMLQDVAVCTSNTPIQLDATVPTQVPPPPTFTNSTAYPIPPGGAPVNSNITVAGVQPPILGLGVIRSVCINVQHPWVDDVDAYLVAPNGTVLELTTDNGGDGDDYTNTCFTPTATTVISFPGPFAPSSAAPFTGEWLPEGPWSDLWGGPANGTWRLRLTDDKPGFNGTLLDWSITFEPTYDVTYQWSPATGLSCADCPNPTVSAAQNTLYTVTATDSYGCTVTETVEVSVGATSAQMNVLQPISCFGQKGTVEVAAPGTNTYLWSTGQTSTVVSNLAPGTYTVTVTNVGAGGCTTTASVTLVQPAELFATASPRGVTCHGLANGTAAVHPSGGTLPYSFVWNTGAQADSIANLAPGTYTVTVSDANGCSKTSSMNVIEPAPVQILTALNRSPSCFGLSDGQLTTYAVGGTTPFSFVWNTGQQNQGITNIPAGTYTVTATDGNGCTQVKTETVTQPALLTSFVTPEPVKCFGGNTGKLNLDVAGGTPPYSANWTGPNAYTGSGLNIANLLSGPYTATVTDSKGCTSTSTVNLSQAPELLLPLPAVADTICFFGTNGTATAVPVGGTPPYTYLWSANGQTAQTAVGLASNEYQVTVTDANGCKTSGKTFVAQQQELNGYGQAQPPRCHNGSDGTGSMVSVFYGATPANVNNFSYAWNTAPPKTGLSVSGLVGGKTYTVTITDALGCTATVPVPVPNPFPIETAITGYADSKCHGEPLGSASAKAVGGTAPYQWFWSGGTTPTDSLAQGLSAGTYLVTITDVYGCPGTASVTIGQPPKLKVQTQAIDVKCFGESTGAARAIPSGGVAPYKFLWENGAQTAEIGQLPTGAYLVSVTDANGCLAPSVVEVGQPGAPLSGQTAMEPPRCFGGHDGRILLSAAGGTPPYRYGLGSQPFNGSPVQIGIKAGTYVPKIMDVNGCELALAPIEVTQPSPILLDLGPDIRILYGEAAQLSATVQGAQGAVTYAWRQEDSPWLSCLSCPAPEVAGLEYSNHFELVVTDENGCRAEDQVLVVVEKPRKVHVPTGFTPNGDFTNDRLVVHGQSTARVVEFKVFDRWGEMVFQQKDYAFNDDSQGWDGTFRGRPCDPGVYVWILEVEYSDGVREVFKGNTTLIR